MGTLGVDIEIGERFIDTANPYAAAAEGGNNTSIIPFSAAFREEQVLVAKLVHLLIHENNDIDSQMLVVPRKYLWKGPTKSLFYAIICLILFASSFSHCVTSLPLKLFRPATDLSYYQPQPATYNQCQHYFQDRITQQSFSKNDYDREKVGKHGNIHSGIPTPEK